MLGEHAEGIHTLRSAQLAPEAGRAGGEKRTDVSTILNSRNSTMPSHYKYKESYISAKMALRHKIGVPDNTGIYHISVFRHTAFGLVTQN